MQVKIKQEQQVFKPMTLEITFESKEELTLITDMLRLDVSIPELVYHKDENAQQRLVFLMQEIAAVIQKAVKGSE